MGLGVVDLAAPVDEQVRAMRDACEDLGFFRVPVDAVPRDVLDAAWAATSARAR